jgi:hypothetical protein
MYAHVLERMCVCMRVCVHIFVCAYLLVVVCFPVCVFHSQFPLPFAVTICYPSCLLQVAQCCWARRAFSPGGWVLIHHTMKQVTRVVGSSDAKSEAPVQIIMMYTSYMCLLCFAAGRYHLYIAGACPWANRCVHWQVINDQKHTHYSNLHHIFHLPVLRCACILGDVATETFKWSMIRSCGPCVKLYSSSTELVKSVYLLQQLKM